MYLSVCSFQVWRGVQRPESCRPARARSGPEVLDHQWNVFFAWVVPFRGPRVIGGISRVRHFPSTGARGNP